MKVVRIVYCLAFAALVLTAGASRSHAQQYYGYQGPQQPASSPQASWTCQPAPPPSTCQPIPYGCYINYCPCPCTNYKCPDIPIKTPGGTPCTIVTEGPPKQNPVCIDIYRNCYIPFYVYYQPGADVTPVNFNVRWREVHYLADKDGKPLSPNDVTNVINQLKQWTEGSAPAPAAVPQAPPVPKGAANFDPAQQMPTPMVALPTAPPAPTPPPAAPPATTAATPKKQWIWVSNLKKAGYGYIDAAGYAVIDEGTYRDSMPTDTSSVPAPTTGPNQTALVSAAK